MRKKSIFENKGQKKPLACVRWHKPVYVGTSLQTQVEFQIPMKGKLSALKINVWNKSHIVLEPFQTPILTI